MNLNDYRIGFIGAGNMANSLIRGLLATGVSSQQILAADIDSAKLKTLESECGIGTTDSETVSASVDVLVLAVKPQVMATVCRQLSASINIESCLVVSVAAGITVGSLQDWLGNNPAIVRCMPNTPALLGKGATGLYASDNVSDEQRQLAETILRAVGLAIWLQDESDIDTVTALSGSGPAYFFLLMEAMEETAVSMGLDANIARELTCQTALGAAELAKASNIDTAELRRQVTSPRGTTEQALNQFEAGGFRELVSQALTAAQHRSKDLAEELGKESDNELD